MLGFYIGVSSAALEEEIFKDNERSIILIFLRFAIGMWGTKSRATEDWAAQLTLELTAKWTFENLENNFENLSCLHCRSTILRGSAIL